ncbi:MAG: ComEC/Rec2 family competence protein, partial [Anaerolineales bacterium]
AEQTIKHIFPEPQAALLSGILLGIESGIPKSLQDAFIKSGTAHIIAISGFNITLLAGLFMAIFSRLLGRWHGALVSFSLIALYTILVGANASVVRAALMGGLTLFAAQIGRRQSGINSLTFLAALMAAYQPSILWDISFQLSFAATLGLVLYAIPLTEKWILFLEKFLPTQRAQLIGSVSSEWLLFTIAAQLTTLPIILYHFQRLSIISLIANPLILPVQPILMVSSGLALLGGMVFQPLGQWLAYFAYPFVAYTIRMVDLFGNIPYSSILLNPLPLYMVILLYLGLLILTFAWQSLSSYIKQISPVFIMIGLFIFASLTWQTASRKPDGLLHLILLDVNQSTRSGEALLIQTPQGRYVLIDGGPSKSNLLSALDEWMPITWRKIDWLIIGGVYDNQLSALPELVDRNRVAHAWWAIPNGVSASAATLQEELKRQQVPIIQAQPNQELDLGQGIRLKVIAMNKSGALLLLEWNQFRAFLPIGFDSNTRDEVLQSASFPPVTIWLLANRGAEWLNPSTLLARLQPQLILINAAKGEWSGLPNLETIQTLEGQNVLRSDINGWVHITTNGQQMWVEAEK